MAGNWWDADKIDGPESAGNWWDADAVVKDDAPSAATAGPDAKDDGFFSLDRAKQVLGDMASLVGMGGDEKPRVNSVLNDAAPLPELKTTSRVPVKPELRKQFEGAWDAATPKERDAMAQRTDWLGQLARERAGVFERLDASAAGGSDAAQGLDTRVEARVKRIVNGKDDPRFVARAAQESAAAGAPVGKELAFVGKKHGLVQESDFDFETKQAFDPKQDVNGLNNPLTRGITKGVAGVAKSVVGVGEFLADVYGLDHAKEVMRSGGEWARGKEQAIGERGTMLERNLEGAIGSIAQQLPAMAIGAAKGVEAIPLAAMAVQSFGQEYSDGRKAGQSVSDAATRAGLFSAFEVLGERLGLGDQLKAIAGVARGMPSDQIVGFMWSAFKKEVPGELMTTTGQFATDKLPGGVGLHTEAGFKDYMGQAADTIVQTMMQSTMMTGGATGASKAARMLQGPRGEIEKALADALNGGQFTQAGNAAKVDAMLRTGGTSVNIAPAATSKAAAAAAVERARLEQMRAPRPTVADIGKAASVDEAIATAEQSVASDVPPSVQPAQAAQVPAGTGRAVQLDEADLLKRAMAGIGIPQDAAPLAPAQAAPVVAPEAATPAAQDQPVRTWFGRRGDGYATPEDAQRGLSERQRLQKDLQWRIEQTPEGRYRLAGYAVPVGGTQALQTPSPKAEAAMPKPLPAARSASQGQDIILQNRDRNTPASIDQMQSIAANPDYLRAGPSRTLDQGAPVAFGAMPPSAVQGRAETVADGRGQRIQTQYAVVEAADLLASNQADGTPLPEYATGESGRLRVVAGNGRTAGLQAAYLRGTAAQYREELQQDAQSLGIDPQAVAAMREPVLIRVMDEADVTPDIADRSNIQAGAEMSAVERANNDARRIHVSDMEFHDNGTPTEASLLRFIQSMPVSERGGLVDDKGPTQQAIDRVMAVAFKQAYGGDELVRLFAQATDPESRVVIGALARIAGRMAQLDGAAAFDIRGAIADAAGMAITAKRRGKKLADIVLQGDLDLSPEAVVVARFMADNIRSGQRIADGLLAWVDLALDQVRIVEQNASSTGMFGEEPTLPRQQLFERLGKNGNTATAIEEPAAQRGGTVATGEGAERREAEPAGDGRGAEDGAGGRGAETEGSGQQVERGPFGPILTQYRHDAQGAIRALKELQDGEAVAALHHPEVGDIDLVWGHAGTSNSDGLGLAKLVQRHPEVLGDLQGFLNRLHKDAATSGANRIRLIGDGEKAVVRLQWDGQAKTWLLTAFENAPKDSTRTDTGAADVKDDTASLNPERQPSVAQDLLGDKPNISQQQAADERARRASQDQQRRNAAPAPEEFALSMVDARTGREVDPNQQELLGGLEQEAPANDFTADIAQAERDLADLQAQHKAARGKKREELASRMERLAQEIELLRGVADAQGANADSLPGFSRKPSAPWRMDAGDEGVVADINRKIAPSGASVTAVASFDELPQLVKEKAKAHGVGPKEMRGITLGGGRVFVVHGNHSSLADVQATIVHEVYGHVGLRALFGPDIYRRLNKLYLNLGDSKVRAMAEKYGVDATYFDMANQLKASPAAVRRAGGTAELRNGWLAEELLAHIAERETGTLRQQAREVIGAIRAWLREHGFMQLSDMGMTDIAHILKQGRLALETQSNFDGVDAPPVFAIKEKAPAQPRNLVVLHNLTAENLIHADSAGGLPVPSLGITKVDSPFSGYGNITLIGPSGMTDPAAGVPVYDRDAYTSRFPTMNYKRPKRAKTDALYERMQALRDLGDDGGQFLSMLWGTLVNSNSVNPSMVAELFDRYTAARMLYAQEVLGKTIKTPMRDVRPATPVGHDAQLLAYWKKHGAALILAEREMSGAEFSNTPENKAFEEEVQAAIRRYADAAGAPEIAKGFIEQMMPDGTMGAGTRDRLIRDFKTYGTKEVDRIKLGDAVNKAVKRDDPAYLRWVESLVKPLFDEPTITLLGKEVAPTLDNLVAAMTMGATVGAEKTMTTSSGKVAAMLGKRFKSIAEIQAARDQVVSEAQEEDTKKSNDATLTAYRNAALAFFTEKDWRGNVDTWAGMDEAMEALADAGKRGSTDAAIRQALAKRGFRGVDDATVELARQSIDALRNSPTNYFEAKPQRAVGLGEFRGAVLPRGTDPKVLEILAGHGIEVLEYGKGDGAREKAIATLTKRLDKANKDVLFSLVYDFETRQFISQAQDAGGIRQSDDHIATLVDQARAAGLPAGRTTVSRAVLTGTFIRGEGLHAALRAPGGEAVADNLKGVLYGREAAPRKSGSTINTIAAAIRRAYGPVLPRLQANGLVTLVQSQEQAIEAAAQARAAKTGQPVEQARATLRASVKNSVADQTQTENFQRWFKDSKVVDAEGKPLVVYRGDRSGATVLSIEKTRERGIFTTDDEDVAKVYANGGQPMALYMRGENVLDLSKDTTAARKWIYEWSKSFDDWTDRQSGEEIDPVDAVQGGQLFDYEGDWSSERWKDLQASAKADGFDVLIAPDFDSAKGVFKSYIALHGDAQLKSATGNRGTFDPADPDIRRSADGSIQGFFDPQSGQSFLIADGLTEAAAPGVLAHEVGIHMAADTSSDKGKAAFDKITARAGELLKLGRGNPFFDRVNQRMLDAQETSNEEAAAYIAEEYERDRVNAPASVKRWVTDFLAAVRGWLFGKGVLVKASDLGAADIAAIARANVRQAARGTIDPRADTTADVKGSKDAAGNFYGDLRRRVADGRGYREDELFQALAGGDKGASRSGFIHYRGGMAAIESATATAYWDGELAGAEGFFTTAFQLKQGGKPAFLMAIFPEGALTDGSWGNVVAAYRDQKYAWYMYAVEQEPGQWEVGTDGVGPEGVYHQRMVEAGELVPVGNDYHQLRLPNGTTEYDLLREGARRLSMALDGQTPAITFRRATGAKPGKQAAWSPDRVELRFSRSGNTATQGSTYTLPEERFGGLRRKMQDYFIRALEVQNAVARQGGTVDEQTDFYRAEELSSGRRAALVQDFGSNVVNPLMERAAALGVDLQELALYAYAKHAQERNEYIATINDRLPDGGSGMTTADADAILDKVRQEGREQDFEELHQGLMDITASTRALQLSEGLITQDEFDAMQAQYQNYIPLRGFEQVDENDQPTGRSPGKGFNIRGRENLRALGRSSRAGELIENAIHDYIRTVDRGERNQVGKVFLNFVLQNPDAGLWEVDATRTRAAMDHQTGKVKGVTSIDKGEDTIAVKVAGREVYVRIHDPLLLRAMRKSHTDDRGDNERLVVRALGLYTALLRNTLTRYNPEFALTNALRDYGFGMAAMVDVLGEKGAAKFTAHYAGAVAAAHRNELNKSDPKNREWDKYFTEFRLAGGMTAGFYVKNTEEIGRDIRSMLLAAGAAPKTKTEALFASSPARAIAAAGRVLEYSGSVSENAARVAAYRTAREMGKSPSEAASIAKNLTTNFDRKGELGQVINAAYVFYNAAVQGSHRLLKMASNPKVAGYMAGFGVAGVMMALAAADWGGDDPDDGMAYWDKIPAYEKERNLIIMLPPGAQMAGEERVGTQGRYIKIPLQYGLNLPVAYGYAIADVIRNQRDKSRGMSPAKAGVTMASYLAGAFNPFGGSVDLGDKHSVMLAALPSVFDFAYQHALGVNGFGRDVAPFKSPFDTKPDSENYNLRQADSVSLGIARMLNRATGGSAAEAGGIDISAGTVENLIRNVSGGTGAFIYDVGNLAWKSVDRATGGDPDIFVREMPLYRRVYGELGGDVDQGIFYENRKKTQEAAGIVKRSGELDMEPGEEHQPLAHMDKFANKATRDLAKLRREMIRVKQDDSLSDDEKTKELRELRAERDQITAGFNQAFTEIMRVFFAEQKSTDKINQ